MRKYFNLLYEASVTLKTKLDAEIYKTLLSEIKDNLNKWRNIPGLPIGRLNTVKMSILFKPVY